MYNSLTFMESVLKTLKGVARRFVLWSFFVSKKIAPARIKSLIKGEIFKEWKDPYPAVARLLSELGVSEPVIIDGGAHFGKTIAKFRTYFPDARVYAFEPIRELADRLRGWNDAKLTVFNNALGEREEALAFRVNKNSAASSVYEPALIDEYYPETASMVEKISVDCVRIDTLLHKRALSQPDFIKLDLQGYELFALRGAQETLKDTKVVLLETEFVSLYKGQPLFHDIMKYLTEQGFQLFCFYDINHTPSGQIVYADAIFINKKYFGSNPSSHHV